MSDPTAAAGPDWVADAKPILLAILIGAAGGTIASYLRIPLPWMLGAMLATTIAAMSGVNIKLPRRLRNLLVVVLGVMLGSAFTPDLLDRAGAWVASIIGLLIYAAIAGSLVLVYLRKVANYDPVTAYFAASPGGLSEMTIVGREFGGDERIIALTQAARVLLVVLSIPFMYRMFGGYEPLDSFLPRGSGFDIPMTEWAIFAGCVVVGPFLAGKLRLPAAFLMGPMIFSAIAHLTGFSEHSPPGLLVAVAQIVLGTAVGCRFAGVEVREVLRVVWVSIGSTIILISTAVAAGVLMEKVTGTSWTTMVLAYSPGGLAEMSMVAFGIGSDVAFVATHHLARISIIVILAPMAFRLLRRVWKWEGKVPARDGS